MRICIACPAPARSRYGNRISAVRWERILRKLGHQVTIQTGYDGRPCDVLVALHAKRSAPSVFEFRERFPDRPIIVALTGTDLYRDIHHSRTAQRALDIATRLVALQPLASEELAPHLNNKLRVIYQSIDPLPGSIERNDFQVCVVGHLRAVKDPFRAAMAARSLPDESRIQVVHAGAAMDDRMADRARSEEQRNARYRWAGEVSYLKARRLIAASRLLVLSSKMEGGANVISEAIVERTPVLASRIPGSIGLLGVDYPGFYPFGDTQALRDLMLRAESDPRFYRELSAHCEKLRPTFRPARELSSWRQLLKEL